MLRPSASVTTTRWPAARPHGTRPAVPLSRQPPPARARRSVSSRWTDAIVNGPDGTSSPEVERSHDPTMVSAIGSGTACRPAARATTNASPQLPPAPPFDSGTSGQVNPFSSTACQSAPGQVPVSADSSSSFVTRSVKRRVTTSPRIVRSSFIAAPDRERHLPQGGEMGDEAPYRGRGALARVLRHLPDQLEQQREAREVALRTAALEGKLGRHLLPARALLADPHVLGHEDVLEDDHVEVTRAGQVYERADPDAGKL